MNLVTGFVEPSLRVSTGRYLRLAGRLNKAGGRFVRIVKIARGQDRALYQELSDYTNGCQSLVISGINDPKLASSSYDNVRGV